MRISQAHLDSGKFMPDSVLAGEFTILGHPSASASTTPAVVIPHSDFVGKYTLTPTRTLTAQEQALPSRCVLWFEYA